MAIFYCNFIREWCNVHAWNNLCVINHKSTKIEIRLRLFLNLYIDAAALISWH